MNVERLTNIAQGVARAHIVPLGFTLSVEPYGSGVTLVVSNRVERHLENLCLKGMPEAVQEEYVHCRVHAFAARLIATRYPA